ncbi:manganese/zinc/iron transport system substrate-binding protein [Paenibacillus phyllosphaerae]|uniref:Manganese/zinc/iron transport system substrate-binding protein n=1 Tax=Paenibacillus phyllosphaerae TaxID=274593 RepID=A0A7W5AUK4_9BACL|nr:zinc ABC transporter substrate-binding protein [Paenibacillus phyllosphaerae]MBB3108441.1 manganese/zinc/iron transport system substrate-binding protein [Paenibacillus phyllosphaerae]
MRHKVKAPFRRWMYVVLFLTASVLVLSGCADSKETTGAEGEGKLKITTTTGMIADVAANIGGAYVDVTGLMGSGVDPHLYKATQGDIRKLDDADIIFFNGLHLEGKMTEMFDKMAEKKTVVAVSEQLPESALRTDGSGVHDPHIWFNVRNWISAAEVIRDTLMEQDPEHADAYRTQAEAYLAELEQLDTYVSEQIASIPEADRVLVTAHDAFGYFGDAYGIQVMGLQGISTASEYGSKDVANLRDYLVDNKIKAVFVESSVPKKSIEAVIEGAAKLGHEVKIGGELFSDALGPSGTEEGTYIGMVRHNVDTIAAALK